MKKLKLLLCFGNTKRAKLCFISLFTFIISFCEGQTWEWAKSFSNHSTYSTCDPTCMSSDTNGNIFQTGELEGSVTFGTDTVAPLDTLGIYFYLTKFDHAGNTLWARAPKLYSSSCYSTGTGVATDKSGNSYVTGYFYDTLSLGPYIFKTSQSVSTEIFTAKYDEAGNLKWAAASTSPTGIGNDDWANGIAVDNNKNVFITGFYYDTLHFGSFTIYNNDYNVFVVKYDSNGNVQWAFTSNNIAGANKIYSYSIATDNAGCCYITGSYFSSLIFGNDTITALGYGLFLVKLSPAGTVDWAKSNTGGCYYDQGFGVTTDRWNNVYLTGSYCRDLSFGYDTLQTTASADVFVAKFDSSGNEKWIRSGNLSSKSSAMGFSLIPDKWNNIYLSGYFNDTLNMNGYNLSSTYQRASFIDEMDSAGHVKCGTVINDYYDEGIPVGHLVAVSNTTPDIYFGDDLYTPKYSSCIIGQDTIKGKGWEIGFLAKWEPCFVDDAIPNIISDPSPLLSVFPNPFSNSTTIVVESEKLKVENYLELDDITGRKIKQIEFTGNSYTLSAEGLAKGMYFVRVSDKDKNVIGTSKIVVQ